MQNSRKTLKFVNQRLNVTCRIGVVACAAKCHVSSVLVKWSGNHAQYGLIDQMKDGTRLITLLPTMLCLIPRTGMERMVLFMWHLAWLDHTLIF
jgi:hypothetical protein